MDRFLSGMQAIRFWIVGLVVIAVGFAVWKASTMILIVISAIVLSIFIESLATLVQKYLRLPRFLSIIGVFLLVIAIFAFLIVSAIPVFIDEISALKPFLPEGDSLDKLTQAFTGGAEVEQDAFISFSPELISQVSGTVKNSSQTIFKLVASVFGGFANVVLLGVMSLYLALEDRAIERLIFAIAPRKSEQYIASLWRRIRLKTEGWFRGQVLVACVVGVLTYVGLLILKVKYAFLLASLAAVLGIIPFGIIVAFLPALGIALTKGAVLTPVYVTILYGSIQYLTDYVIQPLVTRRVTGLPPLLVIISIVVCLTLFGFLGFFIAIPASICLLEMVKDIEREKTRDDEDGVHVRLPGVPSEKSVS